MTDTPVLEHIRSLPGVRGCVQCDAQGKTVSRSGAEVDALAEALGDVVRIGSRVGSAFGFKALDQAELYNHAHAAACVTFMDGAVGVMLASRAGASDVVVGMKAAMGKT